MLFPANPMPTMPTAIARAPGYVIGPDNEILSDGTYTYTYDAEGNRTAKFVDTNADGVLDSATQASPFTAGTTATGW